MHNLKNLRKNLDIYKKKFNDRNLNFNIDEFSKIDEINRNLINKKELLEQEKKFLSRSKDKSNFEKSKKLTIQINKISSSQIKSQKELDILLSSLPNLANEDVPVGKDDKSNKLIKKVGELRKFSFKVKSHIDLGSIKKRIDFDKKKLLLKYILENTPVLNKCYLMKAFQFFQNVYSKLL